MVGSNRSHIDFKGGGRQLSLQPLLQKGQYDSDRALPGGLLCEKSTIRQTGSTSRCKRVSCALAEVMVLTTSWGRSPGTSVSHSGTFRDEVSRGLDTGATRCPISESVYPSSEESAEEGLSRGASAPGTRSEWANMGPRAGPAPHPP